ncbi:sonic hedgehog A [Micractinium conductrix]|uniref:Sonic hedgehog A n=1 Tax=Micractinium conductrix TaxID=554055 RepID=A0A2P6VIY3_9CHLO|nr:sonic hedgehog A [Micractinium conductrix]|eukprot:PSC74061.1 sonic hedgehog A [Micractinium conductrix]
MQNRGANAARLAAVSAAILLLGAATAHARPTRSLQQFDCTAAQQLCEKQSCKGKLDFKCDTATSQTDCTCISAGLAGCFSGTSSVATPAGPKRLSQLQLGEAVLSVGAGGALQFSPVYMFSSRRPAERSAFLRVRTDAGLNLTVTPGHYLFAWRGEGARAMAEAALGSPAAWPYVLPTQLAVGDVVPVALSHVVASSGVGAARPALARVTAVEEVVEEGVFMPHTHRRDLPTAAAGQTAVAESLHLLSFPPNTSEEDIASVVDGVWSLQYLAAGPICGSAGPLAGFRRAGAAAEYAGDAGDAPTHAVLFRYSNEVALLRFESQPRVQLMLGGTGAPQGTAITTLNFQGRVPSELEAIFRRGPEWGEGVELVLAMALQGGATQDEAGEFLQLTQQLAVSSAFGAVQCSYGACIVQHRGDGDAAAAETPPPPPQQQQAQQQQQQQAAAGGAVGPQPDVVLLARFQDDAQLQQFLACPPVAALLEGDDRLPLRALWSAALLTQPSDSSSSQGVGGGLL